VRVTYYATGLYMHTVRISTSALEADAFTNDGGICVYWARVSSNVYDRLMWNTLDTPLARLSRGDVGHYALETTHIYKYL
jgi:hypothetical protein